MKKAGCFLLFLLLINTSFASYKGIAGFWRLNEGIGNIVEDLAGGNEGEIIGDVEWEKEGQNNVLHFKKGFVKILDDSAWNIGEGFLTISLYVKTNKSWKGFIIEHSFGGAVPGNFGIYRRGVPAFGGYNDKAKEFTVPFKGFEYDKWQHLVVVVKKAKNGWVKTYLNGKMVNKLENLSYSARTPGNLYIGARGSVGDSFFDGYVKDLMIFKRELTEKEIEEIYNGKIPFDKNLVISRLKVEKILYSPEEKGKVDISFVNLKEIPQKFNFRLNLISFLNTKREIYNSDIELSGNGRKSISIDFNFKNEEYGCELEGIISKKGKIIDRKSSVFSVSNNLWKVAIGAEHGPWDHSALYTEKRIIDAVESLRKHYINWFEACFWAPDDWGYMNPKEEKWFSGQARRYHSKKNLKILIDECHKYGIKAITYGKGVASAPWGLEIARKHPEWFKRALNGGISSWGTYDVWQIDNWNKIKWGDPKQKYFSSWLPIFPDFRNIEAVDWGIEQLIKSKEEFGWDGVRFDGQFSIERPDTKPNREVDEWSTFNMQRMKKRIWEKFPDYVFGYNWAWSPKSYFDKIEKRYSHEFEESMAGGGLYMAEAMNTFHYDRGKYYKKWSVYNTEEAENVDIVSKRGGIYLYIMNLKSLPPIKRLYKFIIAISNRVHPCYGDHLFVGGCNDWGRFLTRWSSFFWNTELNRIKYPEKIVRIENENIWWKDKVYEFVENKNTKYLIVHLINPPGNDQISADIKPPSIVKNLEISIKVNSDEKIKEAYCISPSLNEYSFSIPLKVIKKGNEGKVSVPELKYWDIIVFKINSLSGSYKKILHLSKFTKPADLNKEEIKKKYEQEMKEKVEELRKGISIWRAAERGWNSRFVIKSDIEAKKGSAAVVDKDMRSGTMFSAFWATPGIYRVTWRIKIKDVNEDISIRLSAYPARKTKFSKVVSKNVSFSDFGENNVYKEFSLKFEHRVNENSYTALVVSVNNCKKGDVFVDTLKTELLKAYTQKELSTINPELYPPYEKIKQEMGEIPDTKTGIKLLVLKGWWWNYYRIKGAVEYLGKKVVLFEDYPDPTKKPLKDYSKYNVIILANYSTGGNYKTMAKLRSFVEKGGKLIILGGLNTLGQGGFKYTYLEDILPVELKGAWEVIKGKKPLVLASRKGKTYKEKPSLYYYHNVNAKNGVEILMWAGDKPVLLKRKYGKGSVIVFTGTVMGDKQKDEKPFWEWEKWPKIMAEMIEK